MSREVWALWAKKNSHDGEDYWLPLLEHLNDTRGVCVLLWRHWLSQSQKNMVMDSIGSRDEELAEKLVAFLGAVHDIGKATPAFQTKNRYINSNDLNDELLNKLKRYNLVNVENPTLSSENSTPHNIASQVILEKFGIGSDIAAIVGAHHGRPIDEPGIINEQMEGYKKNYYYTENEDSELYKKWEYIHKNILDWAIIESGLSSINDLPEVSQPAQFLLSGLLILADWIASNENYFPLYKIHKEVHEIDKNRIESGFIKWRKNSIWEPEYQSDISEIYKYRFGFLPREFQEKLGKIVLDIDDPGIIIVEAPMGEGKTEASLVSAELIAQKKGLNGIFFGLPTQATSDSMFYRCNEWVEKLDGDKKSLRLVHGKAHLNDVFQKISSNIYDEGYEDSASVFVNDYFNGRKAKSLDDFVVGTVDQFLMVALKQKHLALRHLGFSKKVVIIDEVHAYDAYMNQYLLQAIRWMSAYKVPVIILSATLPKQKRFEMVEAYLQGSCVNLKNEYIDRIKNKLNIESYPLITYTSGEKVDIFDDFEPKEDKKFKIIKSNNEDIINIIKESTSDGGIVGIIVNTVKKAQELTLELSKVFGEENIDLLHSNFIDTDRKKKEKELLKIIGKNTERPFRRIIIGTQVIEQSLDIDFDVLITDLAPMDLLLQRMGRLHRHNISRPNKLVEPKVYVLGISDDLEFEKGSASVYGEYILARTQYYLKESINIPSDISELVQIVYGFDAENKSRPDEDVNIEKNLDRYIKYKAKYIDMIESKKSSAKGFRIASPCFRRLRKKPSIIGFLKVAKDYKSEESMYAQVRDIDETIEVIALKKSGDTYTTFSEIEVGNLDKEKFDDFIYQKYLASNTIRLPSYFSKFRFDETVKFLEDYRIANLNEWSTSAWLKGCLGIIFDENNSFELLNKKLVYDKKYGLKLVEEE